MEVQAVLMDLLLAYLVRETTARKEPPRAEDELQGEHEAEPLHEERLAPSRQRFRPPDQTDREENRVQPLVCRRSRTLPWSSLDCRDVATVLILTHESCASQSACAVSTGMALPICFTIFSRVPQNL